MKIENIDNSNECIKYTTTPFFLFILRTYKTIPIYSTNSKRSISLKISTTIMQWFITFFWIYHILDYAILGLNIV